MAKVLIDIADGPDRLTLKVMLEADGYDTGLEDPDVVITDDPEKAIAFAASRPALLVARAAQIPAAVAAMRKGVYGYIFVPFQPGEAGMMIRKALAARRAPVETVLVPGPIAEAETRLILETLKRCRNNQSQAAKMLGIGRNTLWRKLRKIRGRHPGAL